MNLRFKITCHACPEQYDVLDSDNNNKIVAYVRLRWGTLRCDVPDVYGETIYRHEFSDGMRGMFANESQRKKYLSKIREAILEHYHRNSVEE